MDVKNMSEENRTSVTTYVQYDETLGIFWPGLIADTLIPFPLPAQDFAVARASRVDDIR